MGRDKTSIHEIKLATTVKKLCNLIDTIDDKVIVVGHSKNGILISQVAEYRPEKIEKLIYLALTSYQMERHKENTPPKIPVGF